MAEVSFSSFPPESSPSSVHLSGNRDNKFMSLQRLRCPVFLLGTQYCYSDFTISQTQKCQVVCQGKKGERKEDKESRQIKWMVLERCCPFAAAAAFSQCLSGLHLPPCAGASSRRGHGHPQKGASALISPLFLHCNRLFSPLLLRQTGLLQHQLWHFSGGAEESLAEVRPQPGHCKSAALALQLQLIPGTLQ